MFQVPRIVRLLGSTGKSGCCQTHQCINESLWRRSEVFYGNTDIPLHLQIRWFKAIFFNLLLWGCKRWALTLIQDKKVQFFYRWCLRYMLRVTIFHKAWNDVLLELAGVDDSILTMSLRQCRWLDKLAYMPKTIIPFELFGRWVLDMIKTSN